MYAKFSFLSFLARARPLGSILIQLFPKPGENPVLGIYSRGRGRGRGWKFAGAGAGAGARIGQKCRVLAPAGAGAGAPVDP